MEWPKQGLMVGILALFFLVLVGSTVPAEEADKIEVIVLIKEEPQHWFDTSTVKEKQEDIIVAAHLEDVTSFEKIPAVAASVTPAQRDALDRHPAVAAVIPNIKMELFLEDSIPLINADDVHSMSVSGMNIAGSGAGVCVVDTGIDQRHPDLQDNIVAQYCYCNNNGTLCCPGNTSELFGNATDENGHGTHVSGIVAANALAAEQDNNLVGVAKKAGIVAVKVFGKDRSTWMTNVLKGIDFCIANKENYSISVITMSLGTDLFSTASACDANLGSLAFTEAASAAYDAGIMMVAASGNNGATTGVSLPACLSNVTAVGSTTKGDSLSAFTNRNELLDVLAPGQGINSTAQKDCPAGGSGQVCSNTRYITLSGTSMATPHAAGLIALASQYSQLVQNRTLRVDELRVLLRNTGTPIGDAATGLTFPRIDAWEVIDTIREPVKYSTFNSSPTTAFSSLTLEELESLSGAKIGNSHGMIQYNTSRNFLGMNLNDSLLILEGNVAINVSREPELNATVTVTIKNPSVLHGTVLEDGSPCGSCVIVESTADNLTFTASDLEGYANFTIAASGLLNIFDDADLQRNRTVRVEDEATFFANYTSPDGAPITNATCTLTLSGLNHSMVYNPSTTWYEHTALMTTDETIAWNVSCGSSNTTPTAAADTITIAPFLFRCKDYTLSNKNYLLNVSVEENLTNTTGTCVTVRADNVTIDCAAHGITNRNDATGRTGIAVVNARNTLVKNCTLSTFATGLLLDNATGARVFDSVTDSVVSVTGAGGFNELTNATFTTISVAANTTTLVQPSWRVSVAVTDNNSVPLASNITITHRNGSMVTFTNVHNASLLLSEGIYGTATTPHTPHSLTVASGTFTQHEQQFNITETRNTHLVVSLSPLPRHLSFDANTTNFSEVPDLENISSFTLEKSLNGSVSFFGGLDVRGKNFDRAISLGRSFLSVNTTMLGAAYANTTARVVLKGAVCPVVIVASDGTFTNPDSVRAAGFVCNENSSTVCMNISCVDGAASFTVSHFSSFTLTPNAEILLSSDAPKQPNQTVTIQLNYRNVSSSGAISDAVCFLSVNNQSVIPAFNAGTQRYEHQLSFATEGTHFYNATCDSVSFTKLSAENTLVINASAPNASSPSSGGSGSGGSSGSGGGGSGGGGPYIAQPSPASTAPAAPAAIESLTSAAGESSPEAASMNEPEPEVAAPSADETVPLTGELVRDAGTESPLTGRIAGIGRRLKIVKEDGEFSVFGLVVLLGLLTALVLGLSGYGVTRIHFDRASLSRLKIGMGSFGFSSNVVSALREKTMMVIGKVRQKLPARKKYLFEEKEQEKKFEF